MYNIGASGIWKVVRPGNGCGQRESVTVQSSNCSAYRGGDRIMRAPSYFAFAAFLDFKLYYTML